MSNKIGVSISIDVTAISREHMFKHTNGKTYLDMTVFIDPDSPDSYGNHGMVTQKWKDSPKQGTPILGNAKVFWRDQSQSVPNPQSAPQQPTNLADAFDSDLPFS